MSVFLISKCGYPNIEIIQDWHPRSTKWAQWPCLSPVMTQTSCPLCSDRGIQLDTLLHNDIRVWSRKNVIRNDGEGKWYMHVEAITLNFHRGFAEIHMEYNACCIIISPVHNLDQVAHSDIVAIVTWKFQHGWGLNTCLIHMNSDCGGTKTIIFGIVVKIVVLYQRVNQQNWVLNSRYSPMEASVWTTVDPDIVPNLDWVLGQFRVVGIVI